MESEKYVKFLLFIINFPMKGRAGLPDCFHVVLLGFSGKKGFTFL